MFYHCFLCLPCPFYYHISVLLWIQSLLQIVYHNNPMKRPANFLQMGLHNKATETWIYIYSHSFSKYFNWLCLLAIRKLAFLLKKIKRLFLFSLWLNQPSIGKKRSLKWREFADLHCRTQQLAILQYCKRHTECPKLAAYYESKATL